MQTSREEIHDEAVTAEIRARLRDILIELARMGCTVQKVPGGVAVDPPPGRAIGASAPILDR